MNSKDDHLSPEEISAMLGPEEGAAVAVDRQRHAQSCEQCRLVLGRHREAQEELRGLARREPAKRSAQCPPQEDWVSLACGMLPPPREQTLLQHATGCDYCGALLAAVSTDLALEMDEQDGGHMRALRTADPAWQREMARKMSQAARPARPILSNWLARAAALILAVGSGGGGYLFWAARQPARLLAAAYAEQRPFEYRIPQAGHAPVRVEKSGGSSFQRPADLLRAEASIAEALRRQPESVPWLALRARAEMLAWDAESAIATLQRALERKPGDSALEAALGMAYALRAEKANRAIDYGQAIEHLSRALQAEPANREATFNRALVYERMFLLEEAGREWKRYLELDSSGPWAGEARLKLEDIERRIKARRDALGKITNRPEDLLRRINDGEEIEVESYLDVVVADWLPKRWEDDAIGRALEALGARLESRHRDRWLRGLLAVQRSPQGEKGLAALAIAFQENQRDHYAVALECANQAAADLRAAGDPAAALRAETEAVYALQRRYQTQECISRASDASKQAADHGYAWLSLKMEIDGSICRASTGDYGSAAEDLTRIASAARAADYPLLDLMATGILMGTQQSAGNLLVAWNEGREALARFWAEAYPAIRAQQFYAALRRSADQLGWPHSAYGFCRAAVDAISESPHRMGEAVNRMILASMAAKAGREEEASREFERAEALFAQLGSGKIVGDYRMRAQIEQAEMETRRGSATKALERLRALEQQALGMDSDVVRQRFHLATGETLWQAGRLEEAHAAYQKAIALSERALASQTRAEDRVNALGFAGRAYRGQVEARWRQDGPEAALQVWEWYLSGDHRGDRQHTVLDLHRFKNETFVALAYLPGGWAVWAFDDRGVAAHRPAAGLGELEAAALRFIRSCSNPAWEETALQRDARQIYDWLLAPLADKLDGTRTLVFLPDGLLSGLPLQALMDQRLQYVGDRHPIVIASSASDYARRATAPTLHKDSRVLVIANPALRGEMAQAFPPLRQTIREAQIVTARFPRSTVFSGETATLETLNYGRARFDLLHFAGHGFSNAGNGGLVLAPSAGKQVDAEILDGKQITRQDWSYYRLVILSACSAGIGEARGPVNPESLVRHLLWAGVPRVVASFWNVDAETSVLFMDGVYAALQEGRHTAAALQHAAQRLRRHPATQHPYYWAGFQSFGSSR